MSEKKSILYTLEPIIKRWPAVTKPEGHVHFRVKMVWTLVALVAYFMLGNIQMYGLSDQAVDLFAAFRAILAGQSGSIIHLGIGPIVTGGIILQLFVGAKIINLNLKDTEDKAIYQGTQKMLIFLMLWVEGIPQVFGFVPPSDAFASMIQPGIQSWLAVVIGLLTVLGFGFGAAKLAGTAKGPGFSLGFSLIVGIPLGLLYMWLVSVPLAQVLGLPGPLQMGPFALSYGALVALVVGGLLMMAGYAVGARGTTGATEAAPAFAGPSLGALVVGLALTAVVAFTFVPSIAAGMPWARFFIAAQLAVGGYLIWLMDEVVSKWGIGSGVSLFIVAGIGQAMFTGLFSWVPISPAQPLDPQNPPAGLLPKSFYLFDNLSLQEIVYQGGFEQIAFGGGLGGSNTVVALISTIVVFMIVAYAESTRVELPLAHARVRGARGRYPIRLLYASVLPLIFVRALQANVNLLAILLWSGPLSRLPFIGHKTWVGCFPGIAGDIAAGCPDIPSQGGPGSNTNPYSGVAYYLSNVGGIQDWLLPMIDPRFDFYGLLTFRDPWQIWTHLAVWAAFTVVGSVIFAIFWVETASMGPADVAKGIQASGMQLPGFRRDPRVLERVLERYIPTVTVISGAAVGGLSVFADMWGTIGQASGTGLLLAVGILSRLYDQVAKERVMEMHPMVRGLFGQG